MIKWMLKYGAVIFMLNIFLASIESTFVLSSIIFKVIMVIYSILFLVNIFQLKNVIFHKAFSVFLFINLINIFYFLLFHSINDFKAIQFLLARIIQFTIISTSIYYNFEYYKQNFLNHLTIFVSILVTFGFLLNPDIISDRYSGLIWNSNTLSVFVIMAFSILLLKEKRKEQIDYLILGVLLLTSLATGSRGVIIGIGLAYLIKYRFSSRIFFYLIIGIGLYSILINFNLFTSANRFAEQSVFNDRILQYKYAYETFLQKPLFGFGLDKYSFINTDLIPEYIYSSVDGSILASHNGYIALLIQYGIVFGLFIIFLIFQNIFFLWTYFEKSIDINRTYLYIIIFGVLGAIYETLITGINDFHTFLFWFSIAFLSYSKYRDKFEVKNGN